MWLKTGRGNLVNLDNVQRVYITTDSRSGLSFEWFQVDSEVDNDDQICHECRDEKDAGEIMDVLNGYFDALDLENVKQDIERFVGRSRGEVDMIAYGDSVLKSDD